MSRPVFEVTANRVFSAKLTVLRPLDTFTLLAEHNISEVVQYRELLPTGNVRVRRMRDDAEWLVSSLTVVYPVDIKIVEAHSDPLYVAVDNPVTNPAAPTLATPEAAPAPEATAEAKLDTDSVDYWRSECDKARIAYSTLVFDLEAARDNKANVSISSQYNREASLVLDLGKAIEDRNYWQAHCERLSAKVKRHEQLLESGRR